MRSARGRSLFLRARALQMTNLRYGRVQFCVSTPEGPPIVDADFLPLLVIVIVIGVLFSVLPSCIR